MKQRRDAPKGILMSGNDWIRRRRADQSNTNLGKTEGASENPGRERFAKVE